MVDYSKIKKGISNPGAVPPYAADTVFEKINSNALLPLSIFAHSKFDIGTNVFEKEWDMLVVLDTCRPDALKRLAPEYEFIDTVGEIWSVGGDSWEWMANTFDRRYADTIERTTYVTSNTNARTVLENQLERNQDDERIELDKIKRMRRFGEYDLVEVSDFAGYVPLYDHGIDRDFGVSDSQYPSPRQVTDYGILSDRTRSPDRLVVHYLPPHGPFFADSVPDGSTSGRYDGVELRDEPRERTFEAYLDNLRWGLEEVSLLLRNVDRDTVVITADHGESFSRIGGSHVSGSIKPAVRTVPWVVTTAEDSGTYTPDGAGERSPRPREEQLAELGYRSAQKRSNPIRY